MQIYVQHWLGFSSEDRRKLKQIFGIKQSTHTVVENNQVRSDGHTDQDLSVITVESMQKYLGTKETDFWKLWDEVSATLKPDYVKPIVEEAPVEVKVEVKKVKKAKK